MERVTIRAGMVMAISQWERGVCVFIVILMYDHGQGRMRFNNGAFCFPERKNQGLG